MANKKVVLLDLNSTIPRCFAGGAATILFTAAFLVSLGTTGFQLYLAHEEGCCEFFKSICRNEKKFNDYKEKLKELSDEIDIIYLDGKRAKLDDSNGRLTHLKILVTNVLFSKPANGQE